MMKYDHLAHQIKIILQKLCVCVCIYIYVYICVCVLYIILTYDQLCLLFLEDYYDNPGNVDPFFKGMSSRGPPPLKRGPPVRNGGPPPKRSAPCKCGGEYYRGLFIFLSTVQTLKLTTDECVSSILYLHTSIASLFHLIVNGWFILQGFSYINVLEVM